MRAEDIADTELRSILEEEWGVDFSNADIERGLFRLKDPSRIGEIARYLNTLYGDCGYKRRGTYSNFEHWTRCGVFVDLDRAQVLSLCLDHLNQLLGRAPW